MGGAGTLPWMAPETFHDVYNEDSDVFGFGIVTWEVATCAHPWAGMGSPAVHHLVSKRFEFNEVLFADYNISKEQQLIMFHKSNPLQSRRPDMSLAKGMPEDLGDLMQKCWADEPSDRPSFSVCTVELNSICSKIGSNSRFLGNEHGSEAWVPLGYVVCTH